MQELEAICFQMISAVGMARSMYIEAIHLAKAGEFEQAQEMMQQAQQNFVEGHHAHAKLIESEADGNQTPFSLILMHAEDQMMSAEAFGILAEEFIEIYKQIKQ